MPEDANSCKIGGIFLPYSCLHIQLSSYTNVLHLTSPPTQLMTEPDALSGIKQQRESWMSYRDDSLVIWAECNGLLVCCH